jgi:hypothetical protein
MTLHQNASETLGDHCPNCRQGYEILLVKFGLAGVRMITACPNCALVRGDQFDGQRQRPGWRKIWAVFDVHPRRFIRLS